MNILVFTYSNVGKFVTVIQLKLRRHKYHDSKTVREKEWEIVFQQNPIEPVK